MFLFSPSGAAAVGRIEIFLCSLSKYLDKSIFYSAHETKAVPFTFQTTGKKVDYFGIYTCSLYRKTLFCVSCTVVIDEKNKKTFVTHNLHLQLFCTKVIHLITKLKLLSLIYCRQFPGDWWRPHKRSGHAMAGEVVVAVLTDIYYDL